MSRYESCVNASMVIWIDLSENIFLKGDAKVVDVLKGRKGECYWKTNG